jgi:pantothenate synthetase
MEKLPLEHIQLSLSCGRPLRPLAEVVRKSSRNPELRRAAEQLLKALQTFESAIQSQTTKSPKAIAAIQEILTK